MSDLQRSFAKAKLAGLPFEPPLPPAHFLGDEDDDDEREEETDDLKPLPESIQDDDSSSASSASSASSTGTIRPSPSKHLFARPNKGFSTNRRTLDPLPWNDYFDRELYLKNTRSTETVTHHVYLIAPEEKGPLIVTHHGAGSSGLSFALFASEIHKAIPNCGVLSLDARGHGETTVESTPPPAKDSPPVDLSLQTLTRDLHDVILLVQKTFSWPTLPGLILVGHSLGGAVVTDLAMTSTLGPSILGYAVLDVVEGSALDALSSMQSYLSTRPQSFPSIPSAIEWHTRSRTLRNTTSARISVPSLLTRQSSPTTTTNNSSNNNNTTTTPQKQTYTWRTDLPSTKPFWPSWFQSLSSKFLSAKGGKLLILAGTDRLDKELMIGQMQGKYQLQVFPEAGHFVHEDQAGKTAMVVADFWRRNDGTALVLPPKVGVGVRGRKLEEEREEEGKGVEE